MKARLQQILDCPTDRERLRKALNDFHNNPMKGVLTLKDGTVYVIKSASFSEIYRKII